MDEESLAIQMTKSVSGTRGELGIMYEVISSLH